MYVIISQSPHPLGVDFLRIAFLFIKLTHPPSFRAIRTLTASKSMFASDKLIIYVPVLIHKWYNYQINAVIEILQSVIIRLLFFSFFPETSLS